MAKVSAIKKNLKRKEISERYRAYRAELKKKAVDFNSTPEEREEARWKLQALRRDTSKIRVRNRCGLTGRPHGYLRKFGLSRIAVRELANFGKLPGVTKASW